MRDSNTGNCIQCGEPVKGSDGRLAMRCRAFDGLPEERPAKASRRRTTTPRKSPWSAAAKPTAPAATPYAAAATAAKRLAMLAILHAAIATGIGLQRGGGVAGGLTAGVTVFSIKPIVTIVYAASCVMSSLIQETKSLGSAAAQ